MTRGELRRAKTTMKKLTVSGASIETKILVDIIDEHDCHLSPEDGCDHVSHQQI